MNVKCLHHQLKLELLKAELFRGETPTFENNFICANNNFNSTFIFLTYVNYQNIVLGNKIVSNRKREDQPIALARSVLILNKCPSEEWRIQDFFMGNHLADP